jgi:hypothetical protein
MLDTLLQVAVIGQAVIAGAVVALHLIAPLTKTQKDDEALTWLQWVEATLRRILPAPSPAVAKREEARRTP